MQKPAPIHPHPVFQDGDIYQFIFEIEMNARNMAKKFEPKAVPHVQVLTHNSQGHASHI